MKATDMVLCAHSVPVDRNDGSAKTAALSVVATLSLTKNKSSAIRNEVCVGVHSVPKQFSSHCALPQSLLYREEKFNADIFRRLGELGLLGVTVAPEYGGSGMDASAACIVHEELSAADPSCCLSYLGEAFPYSLAGETPYTSQGFSAPQTLQCASIA